jgi:hypothetical protein
MRQHHSVKFGNGDQITAGPSLESEVFLRIHSRAGTIVLGMNEYQANDIILALKPHAKPRRHLGQKEQV